MPPDNQQVKLNHNIWHVFFQKIILWWLRFGLGFGLGLVFNMTLLGSVKDAVVHMDDEIIL